MVAATNSAITTLSRVKKRGRLGAPRPGGAQRSRRAARLAERRNAPDGGYASATTAFEETEDACVGETPATRSKLGLRLVGGRSVWLGLGLAGPRRSGDGTLLGEPVLVFVGA
jgi:hypothetical protein